LPELICNNSPLQYLHQLDALTPLQRLAGRVIVPEAVVAELAAGRAQGIELPDPTRLDWCVVRRPRSSRVLRLVADLGAGETAVLALALESADSIVVLDDALARRRAELLNIRLTGTLGVLLDAKRAGLIDAIEPLIDRLQAFGFRLAVRTRLDVLKLAGETH
jgi:predicted nucleic acid-binding protein